MSILTQNAVKKSITTKPKKEIKTASFEIKLEQPVKIYTAKELAAMPLSKMQARRDAQEEYYVKVFMRLPKNILEIHQKMSAGEVILMNCELKRTKTHSKFFLNGTELHKRIINQLSRRNLIKVPEVSL